MEGALEVGIMAKILTVVTRDFGTRFEAEWTLYCLGKVSIDGSSDRPANHKAGHNQEAYIWLRSSCSPLIA